MNSLFGMVHAFTWHPQSVLACSPSQGPCCTAQCDFKSRTDKCRNDSDCAKEGMCNGVSALCPISEPKENFTVCNRNTQVCIKGVWFLQSYVTANVVYCRALYCELILFLYLLHRSASSVQSFFCIDVLFIGVSQNNSESTPRIKK